jgi:hypothetical protein
MSVMPVKRRRSTRQRRGAGKHIDETLIDVRG